MEKLKKVLKESLEDNFINMTISNPRKKGDIQKVKFRPVLLKEALHYQETAYTQTQVFHKNLSEEGFLFRVCELLQQEFKQAEWNTDQEQFTVLVSKKGVASIKRKKQIITQEAISFSHNRKKQYLLEEGKPVDFLIGLGVMTEEGKVVHSKYNKFRQINRFLEYIEDVAAHFPRDREVHIIDFGCGKSYLTFAMYYYLHEIKQIDVRITGLDLKQDVIRNCNNLKGKYGYEKLTFLHGDIAQYEGTGKVDMVVTLHACDTATDYALAKAVNWGAGVILSVPCCQHELNRQIESEVLKPIIKYGLIKERVAALFTDAMRAQLLEQQGYQVQILEFIDMEHTPKNILIRAVKENGNQTRKDRVDLKQEYETCRDFLHVNPTLEHLLKGENA